MRVGAALIAVGTAMAMTPAAHAASVTLTSPPNGATYYTGGSSAASVPVSATRDLSGCTNGPNSFWSVPFMRDGAPAGGPSSTDNTTLSQSVLVQPGNYTARANSTCGGASMLYSATHSFRVVAGNPPAISDRDLDGVTDPNDECPDIPGVKSNNGCPVLDPPTPPKRDDDKVPDAKDECDTKDGPAWHDGCPVKVPRSLARKPQLRARKSALCTLAKLRAEARGRGPAFKGGGAQVARLKRCYARGVNGVADGWPLLTFWSSAKFKPRFEVYPPELRPQNAPPITRVALKARKGFNVYAVKKEKSDRAVFLPVFSILTAESTPTNTGGRLQVGVIFPAKGSSGYKRIKL